MRNLPEGYHIHVGKDGRLQAWFNGQPLIPGMWWSGHKRWGAVEDCYRDHAERTAINLEAVTEKYEKLCQEKGSYDLRKLLESLDSGVYELQVYACSLLTCVLSYTRVIRQWSRQQDRRDYRDAKWTLNTSKKQLALVVTVLQELGVEVPRSPKWKP